MNHYRLLRDNKESGPYSAEDLILKGFKAYDLIWVEGKSAGWRYPSELPEFQPVAPIVEEQPFDRFFKKGPQEHSYPILEGKKASQPAFGERLERKEVKEPAVPRVQEINIPQTLVPVITGTPLPGYSGRVEPEIPVQKANDPELVHISAPAEYGKGKIHVTLPAGSLRLAAIPVEKVRIVNEAEKEPVPDPAPKLPPGPAVKVEPVLKLEPVVKKQELGTENKETTVSGAEPRPARKKKALFASTGSFSLSLMAGFVIGMATLLGLGIMIGLGISRDRKDQALQALVEKTRRPLPYQANKLYPVSNEGTGTAQQVATANVGPLKEKDNIPSHFVHTPLSSGNNGSAPGLLTPAKKEKGSPVPETKDLGLHTLNSNISSPANNLVIPAAHLEKQVSFNTNRYRIGAFGGISELQCILNNDSRYSLDEVEVELQYILANDKVFKTEKILFREVPPGSQVTMAAPKSQRGIKVTGHIIRIQSKEAGSNGSTVRS